MKTRRTAPPSGSADAAAGAGARRTLPAETTEDSEAVPEPRPSRPARSGLITPHNGKRRRPDVTPDGAEG